jgi:hypothetical protein
MQRQLAAFVEQPSKKNYLAARDAVLGQSPLPLDGADLAQIEALLDDEQHEAVLTRLDLLPPSKVLSPRVHFLAAEAALALGQDEEVELERSLFVVTLQGLLATGDGTRANPYSVCHSCDEYDVAAALGVEPAVQSLVELEGRMCDVMLCSDGRELCFDVTHLLSGSQRTRRRARRPKLVRAGKRVTRQWARARG